MPLSTLLRSMTLAMPLAAALLCTPASARPAYIHEPLHLQAGPGEDYPLVTLLFPGMELEVMGCLPGYTWCDVVTPTGLRGWAWGGLLSFSWVGEPLPVIQFGPSYGVPVIRFLIGDYWGRHYRHSPWYGDLPHWRRAPPPHPVAPPPHREPRFDSPRWNEQRDDHPGRERTPRSEFTPPSGGSSAPGQNPPGAWAPSRGLRPDSQERQGRPLPRQEAPRQPFENHFGELPRHGEGHRPGGGGREIRSGGRTERGD